MPLTLNGSTGIAGIDGSAGTPSVQGTDTNTGVFYPAADTVGVSTGGVERIRVPSTGGVQFNGTTSGSSTIVPAAIAGSYTWTLTNPGVNVNIGFLEVPQVSKTTSYTTVLTDSGKHIYANGTSITITIDSNTNVAYPTGTVLTFINVNSTSLSIAITSDTMYLAGSGSTGTRALAQYGMATAIKMTSTTWLISGSGLT